MFGSVRTLSRERDKLLERKSVAVQAALELDVKLLLDSAFGREA